MHYVLFIAMSGLATAQPARRAVKELEQAATNEAQQRDETAKRAFSNTQIKTADGKCLFVDKLSGDFRANLTPVQIATCGTTDGQGWDVITSGKHNDQQGRIVIVSTLTQACLNVDPRRKEGDRVNMFSCGGRADGGGEVTDSQLFRFDGGNGPLSLVPGNSAGKCLSSKGHRVDVASCVDGAEDQSFSFGGGGDQRNRNGNGNGNGNGTDDAGSGNRDGCNTRSTRML